MSKANTAGADTGAGAGAGTGSADTGKADTGKTDHPLYGAKEIAIFVASTIVKVIIIIYAFHHISKRVEKEGATKTLKTERTLEIVSAALFGVSVIFMVWFIKNCRTQQPGCRSKFCIWYDSWSIRQLLKNRRGLHFRLPQSASRCPFSRWAVPYFRCCVLDGFFPSPIRKTPQLRKAGRRYTRRARRIFRSAKYT